MVIGTVQALTGTNADYGTDFKKGFELAVNQANSDGGTDVGGKKVTFKLKPCDDAGETSKSTECAQKLSSRDGAKAIGIISTYNSFPVVNVSKSGEPFIPVSSSGSASLGEQGSKYLAQYWPLAENYLPTYVQRFKAASENHDLGINSVAILHTTDEFGQSWVDAFEPAWEEAGGVITGKATYEVNDTDLYPQLTELIKDDPDMLAIPYTCPTVIMAIKQARELGYKGPVAAQSSCSPEEIAEQIGWDAIEGSIFEGLKWDEGGSNVKAFKTEYEKAYGDTPPVIAGTGYAQANWIIDSAVKAGSITDVEAIRSAMPETLTVDKPWNFLGVADMNKKGQPESGDIFPRFVAGPNKVVPADED